MTISPNLSRLGTLYCVFSAAAYTAFNICLRDVSNRYDSTWINCVQASVATGVFGVYLAWQAVRGRRVFPPWTELLALAALGLITQIGGVLTIWAMGVIGVGITGTLQMGVMLAASAVLGLIVLKEPVHWQQMAAIAMITVSVICFSAGAQSATKAAPGQSASDRATTAGDGTAPRSAASAPDAGASLRVLLGIAAGVLGGMAFGVLTVGIRKTVTTTTSPEAIVFLINVMGVLALAPLCAYRLGAASLAHTPPRALGVMLAAGAMNLIAFLLITKSLQLTTVVRVNVVNNGLTMALTVIAGIVLFAEAWNRQIAAGILLSAGGILLISLASAAGSDRGGSEAAPSDPADCVGVPAEHAPSVVEEAGLEPDIDTC